MDIWSILLHLFSPLTLLLTTLGTLLGIALGAAPGLNGPIGVALLLPLTYGLEPADGLLMLGGIYMGSSYGGSISAILLNCPGSGEATCTALDGYPLARQGRPKAALYFSIIASSLGGFMGVLVLVFLTPVLAGFALKFGPSEMLVVALAGLTVVGGLSGKKMNRAMFAAAFGVLLSHIGPSVTMGGYRFIFGVRELRGGISLIPLVVGLFAVTEMVSLLSPQAPEMLKLGKEDFTLGQGIRETFKHLHTLVHCTALGIGIGILPGTGGAVASFVSYGEAKRISKHPEKFGDGAPDGIIGPEAANNAAVGGSLVPLLALGIPGSATAAIMYGALTIHNLIPGPGLMKDSPEIAYTFMLGMLLTVVIMFLCGAYGVRWFAKVLQIPPVYLAASVLVLTTIGVYSIRNSVFDLTLTFVFGALGIAFRRLNIPVAPILLGHILGPLISQNLGRCVILAAAEGSSLAGYVLVRPISVVLLAVLALLFYSNFKTAFRRTRSADKDVS